MILVDTSVLIDFFKGVKNRASNKFRSVLLQNIPFGINSFIYQEVLQGAKSEGEYEDLQKYLVTQHFFHPKEPVNSFTRAARIYFECRQKGITIRSTIDCIIAQTAIEHNLSLLHNDNDFKAMEKVVKLRFY